MAWVTWLAVFDHNGELAGSVSQRPDLMPILFDFRRIWRYDY